MTEELLGEQTCCQTILYSAWQEVEGEQDTTRGIPNRLGLEESVRNMSTSR